MHIENNIGFKIKHIRKKNNLTQTQFGDLFFYTDKAISKWETGKGYPDLITVVKIADHFKVTLDYLLRDEILPENYDGPVVERGIDNDDYLDKEFGYLQRTMVNNDNKGLFEEVKKVNKTYMYLQNLLSKLSYLATIFENVKKNDMKLEALKDYAKSISNSSCVKRLCFYSSSIRSSNAKEFGQKAAEVINLTLFHLDENNFNIRRLDIQDKLHTLMDSMYKYLKDKEYDTSFIN